MTIKRSTGTVVAAAIVLLGIIASAGSATANTKEQIRIVCTTNWPEQPEQQRLCAERHVAAADELMKRIEGVQQSSLEFAIAKSCIERAKIKPPSMIDWTQALTCYNKRTSGMAPADQP